MYIHVLGPKGQPIGYFQIDEPSRFQFTYLSNGNSFSGELNNSLLGGKTGVRANGPGFSAWIGAMYFPFSHGDRFTIEIEGQFYAGVGQLSPPQVQPALPQVQVQTTASSLGAPRTAPPGSPIVCRLEAPGMVSVTIMQGPDAQLYFSVLGAASGVTTLGWMAFEGSLWKLKTGDEVFAEISGLDSNLLKVDQIRIKFMASARTIDVEQPADFKPEQTIRPLSLRLRLQSNFSCARA
jgi:hypothetical protein